MPTNAMQPQSLLAFLFIHQRIEQHHDDAESRQNEFRQNADVIHALRNDLGGSQGKVIGPPPG